MAKKIKDVYQSWQDSLLAERINKPSEQVLDDIWNKASTGYPQATWHGWVDHGAKHVLSVLRNLDLLTPLYVYNTINDIEAFVLIAATLLHDIGMIPEENVSTDLQDIANLRLNHGEKGAQIIRDDFKDYLKPQGIVLFPVCEIVKSHHGDFKPRQRVDFPNLGTDALWVRLADELDFGPRRAPTWLLDYIKPDEDELKHWRRHNNIDEPAIDLDLLRIQITGTVESETFVRKLRAEFEATGSQELQKNFLSRGLKKPVHNRTFLIWDCAERKRHPGEDSEKIEARLTKFSDEQFFSGGRYLYNLGRYDIARKCFEDGIKRLTGRWSDMPATQYFYHYLKTLSGLGEYQKALRIAKQYENSDFPLEIRAALAAFAGNAFWKTNKFKKARIELDKAQKLYKKLSEMHIKHIINEADSWALYALTYLEEIRANKNTKKKKELAEKIKTCLEKAKELFDEFSQQQPSEDQSHYTGRFYGARAFCTLLQIEIDDKRSSRAWAEAIKDAKEAFGGAKQAHRNPYGAMCGKYCAAAVYYHKYENCTKKADKKSALSKSARLIEEVRITYDELFGPNQRIYRLWPKIHRLFTLIRRALPTGERSKKKLSEFYGSKEQVDKTTVIYTPLH